MSDDELPTFGGTIGQIPATIIELYGLTPPEIIPKGIEQLNLEPVSQVVLVILDNFGLFEITVYKPEFVIRESKYLLLLETTNPYTEDILQSLIHANFSSQEFHLLEFLQNGGKTTTMIGQESDLKTFAGPAEKVITTGDMTTWVQGSKLLNRADFLSLHFLDFENLYKRSLQFKRTPPENLISRLILRTSKWLTGMFKQLRKNSVMFILGTHGRTKIEMSYTGKFAEWRKASLPIGVLMTK
ncbi:MAG: hypothetical protein EU536_01955 [Promethearchaeota archaeon]|nr:MAG: hypothetical protein EU536_01955 [Candidatus Lokiarchaeota archaeon]